MHFYLLKRNLSMCQKQIWRWRGGEFLTSSSLWNCWTFLYYTFLHLLRQQYALLLRCYRVYTIYLFVTESYFSEISSTGFLLVFLVLVSIINIISVCISEKDYTIGTLHHNWPMSAHVSQAFSKVRVNTRKTPKHDERRCNTAWTYESKDSVFTNTAFL